MLDELSEGQDLKRQIICSWSCVRMMNAKKVSNKKFEAESQTILVWFHINYLRKFYGVIKDSENLDYYFIIDKA